VITEKIVEEDGKIQIVREQDCAGLLKTLKKMRELAPRHSGQDRTRWVGSIPLVMAEEWSRECGAAIGTKEFAQHIKKKLADPDYKNLLVRGQ
jgi:hypothetical protein